MPEKYEAQLLLKVTPTQKGLIADRAALRRITQQEYMRRQLFGMPEQQHLVPSVREIRAIRSQLSSIAAQISQSVTPTGRRLPVSQLFEYAVVLQPKLDKDGEEVESGAIIVEPTTVLARDEGQAQLLAARAIPEEHTKNGRMDRLQVVVRPF